LPKTLVVAYCDKDGKAPFWDWFEQLPDKIQDKCTAWLEELNKQGYELRRPFADYLRDGIYELRFKHQSVNYRVLYFFNGKQMVVLSHGITKQQSKVPKREIELAIKRMNQFLTSPSKHTFKE
jgi:phage-related protein